MNDFIICLDVDETLIHSTEGMESDRQKKFGPFWTYARPGLDVFLQSIAEYASIGIYTAASQKYAENFVNQFMRDIPIDFLLSSKRCVVQLWRAESYGREERYIKDLQKIVKHRHELNRLVAVDDKPYLYPRQYGNIIGVPGYEGAVFDDVLPKLEQYLRHLSTVENVRTIEKRNWMSRYKNDYNMT